MTIRTGVIKTFAGVLTAGVLLVSCGAPKEKAAPPPPPPAGLVADVPRTLSADEAANFAVAVGALPSSATLSHVVADGPLVALHYTDATAAGPVVAVEFLQFDAAHAITKKSRVEYSSDPRIHLAGATSTAPMVANDAVEQSNKTTVLALFDALNGAKVDAVAASLGDDFIDHTGGEQGSKAAWLASLRDPATAKRSYGLQNIAGWEDIVATNVSVGTPGAGGKVQWAPGYDFFRLKDGKIVERWRVNY